jgi:hypothetical protein
MNKTNTEPKKRGRKPKGEKAISSTKEKATTEPKRRGRKPKGGKLISSIKENKTLTEIYKPNIILHLRCKSTCEEENKAIDNTLNDSTITNCDSVVNDPIINNKNIWNKLKVLNNDLHKNNIRHNNTCFWDTCSFNTQPVYIPIEETKGKLKVYGNFCSPECAVAYLFNENLDDDTKWERYSLMNKMYSSIYNYKKNIKPAPDPRYILSKYCGILSIEEYRSLNTNNNKQIFIINKPITNVTPELYETNNEISNIKSSAKMKSFFS